MGLFLLACGPEEDGRPCGDVLTCSDAEFCLVIAPAAGTFGDQSYACKPYPAGCESFADMCYSDPPCGEDWASLYCDPTPVSVGCTEFGDAQEAVCEQ